MLTKQNLTLEEMDEFEKAFGETGSKKRKSAAQVRLYDFEEPDKLSKLNLRAVQLIFSSLERPWSGDISSAVRSKAAIEIHPVHQAMFGACAAPAGSSRTIFELSMDALPGPVLIDMPTTLAAEIVDCMAGGDGVPERTQGYLTRIQREIIKRLMDRMASAMEKAWKPISDVHFSVSGIHTSTDSIDISANEPMLVVGSSWQMNDSEATVSIAMPVSSLEPVVELLDPQRWLKGGSPPKQTSSEPISKLLKSVEMAVSVQLGEARISVRDVLGMEEGDIIRLDAPAGDPLQVKIGGRVRFFARPGLVGKKLSAQIVDAAANAGSDDDLGESRS